MQYKRARVACTGSPTTLTSALGDTRGAETTRIVEIPVVSFARILVGDIERSDRIFESQFNLKKRTHNAPKLNSIENNEQGVHLRSAVPRFSGAFAY
jgi:hypothetical protein